MFSAIRQSLSLKFMAAIIATTFVAVLVSGAANFAYDIHDFRNGLVSDLSTQANILAKVSLAAIEFDDKNSAKAILAQLEARPGVRSAAIYKNDGGLFSDYRAAGLTDEEVPSVPGEVGVHFVGNELRVVQPISRGGDELGKIYMHASYPMQERIARNINTLAAVVAASIVIAALVAVWLQSAVTKPVKAMTDSVMQLIASRDFSQRVTKSTQDEIGKLVDAFNTMLGEIGNHSTLLQQSNQALALKIEAARVAGEEAERERRLLDALLDAVPMGIVVADADGNLFRVNQANELLWGRNLPKSKVVSEYSEWRGWWADGSERQGVPLRPDDWALARALKGEEVSYDVVEIETFDSPSERRTITLSAAPVRDNAGAIVGGVVAQTNITALVEAEKALRLADARKDEFLAMLAHELRNPLAPISAAAELLNVSLTDAARVKRASEVIRRQVRHLTALVDDLLDVSRVTRGLVALDVRDVDLREVIESAVEQAKPLIDSKAHQFTSTVGTSPIIVKGDRKRLVQVVTNVLNNAAKYTPEHGEISLETDSLGEDICIRVRDNGIGMTSETVSTVFDLFAQAERTVDRAQGGLGIGLALVKKIVELHGGGVKALSAGLGWGSEFVILIPLAGARLGETSPS